MTIPRALPAELRYVLQASNPSLPVPDAEGIDWQVVARGIERHGLAHLAGEKMLARDAVPAAQVATLRALRQAGAATALLQLRETLRICALLDSAEIRYLLVKGVALSIQLFGSPGVRSSKDIDLLVEPRAAARVDAILRPLGYERPEMDLAKDELAGHVPKEIGYLNHEIGMMIEVHTRLTENEGLFAPDFETLWETRDTVAMGGRQLPTLGREHLATYLSVHGAKHNWARLMWLLDIAPLTASPEAIDAALAHARRFHLAPVLLHTLWLLHHWFGHEVPAAILVRAGNDRTVRLLNRMTLRFHSDPRWFEQAPRRSWRRFYLNSVLGRITGYAMKPGLGYWRQQMSLELVSPADRMLVTLPRGLRWGYMALRPFGWLIRRLKR
ncbi:nucleotidyltransferase family protein [Sphingomonas sp. G-3-2-10]|uniref:nucleotidyltransferase domain-containing protein n=1 Tax=Sphingomonas sp. G-3-2-10 TaxID=2728838 RepID=UPI00146B899E|nr:nucleotidyltransferase family protein [Sphingomonas sp. G-3-2-10]NML04892.1 nucleotidyltransferase family protein [Sphingomonas sp. G-3-2-10]